MKNFLFASFFLFVFAFFYGCQKSFKENEPAKQNPVSTISKAVADSLASVTVGYNEVDHKVNVLKDAYYSSDWSGKIHFAVFNTTSTSNQHNVGLTTTVYPEDGWVCVGGGAYTMYTEWGAYLFETRPLSDFSGWVVSSKDHLRADAHQLVCQAIGIKIDGVPRDTLINHLKIKTITSSSSSDPWIDFGPDPGYSIIGGGAKIVPSLNGYGVLLVGDEPVFGATDWEVKGKSQGQPDTGTITDYLIEIKNDSIPGFGKVQVGVTSSGGTIVNSGISTASISLTQGFSCITCPGGWSTYDGYGRLLTAIHLYDPLNMTVETKDCVNQSWGLASATAFYMCKKIP